MQHWSDHFVWSADATQIVGITAMGRATVEALQMNHLAAVTARSFWVNIGQHPPSSAS